MSRTIAVADIGGTKSYIALAEPHGSGVRMLHVERYENDSFPDFGAILRAAFVNVRAGQIQQGGSTLTQQLVKSYFLDSRPCSFAASSKSTRLILI